MLGKHALRLARHGRSLVHDGRVRHDGTRCLHCCQIAWYEFVSNNGSTGGKLRPRRPSAPLSCTQHSRARGSHSQITGDRREPISLEQTLLATFPEAQTMPLSHPVPSGCISASSSASGKVCAQRVDQLSNMRYTPAVVGVGVVLVPQGETHGHLPDEPTLYSVLHCACCHCMALHSAGLRPIAPLRLFHVSLGLFVSSAARLGVPCGTAHSHIARGGQVT